MSDSAVLIVGSVIWYRWDSRTNHGFQFGYYGEFNRVHNALASIPGIAITRSWRNRDITLDEFDFEATTGSGELLQIAVGERDRIRKLSGESFVRSISHDRDSNPVNKQIMTKSFYHVLKPMADLRRYENRPAVDLVAVSG